MLKSFLCFPKFQLAEQTFVEALGDGIWRTLIVGNAQPYAIDASLSIHWYKDMQVFHPLEEDGFTVEVTLEQNLNIM